MKQDASRSSVRRRQKLWKLPGEPGTWLMFTKGKEESDGGGVGNSSHRCTGFTAGYPLQAATYLVGGSFPPVSGLWNILTDTPRHVSSVSWNLFTLTVKHRRKVVLLKTFSLFLKLSPTYTAEYDHIYSPFSSSRFPYKLPSFMPFNLFLFSLDNFQVQLVQLISAWAWAIQGSRGNYHWSYSQ